MTKERMPARDYPILPVPFTRVSFDDDFWAPRLRMNAAVTIPYAFQRCEDTGRVANFEKAAGINNDGKKSGIPFDDSDVFKVIEGAAYALKIRRDPARESYIDALVDKIAAAQEPDGYLYTDRTMTPGKPHEWAGAKRWEKESELSHELYNVGHLYEAAVAYYEATGKRKLLDVSLRNADLVDREFGPGRLAYWPGHQEIEIGLVKLYRATGQEKYLKLARFFLETRGPGGDEYGQAHIKVLEQRTAVGHAVRACYMYAAMADVAALTGERAYIEAMEAIWSDVVRGKIFVTGGIGSRHGTEGFGEPFELPNMSAYCETCASIANVFWNHRMFLLHGDAKYIDVLERSLYNALLSGVGMDGKTFFYPNPLQSMGQHSRSPWFGCACCPTNVARFMPAIPGYVYANRDDTVWVNLFVAGSAEVEVGGCRLRVVQETRYPWDGTVRIRVEPERPCRMRLAIRIPGWAQGCPIPGGLYRFADAGPDGGVRLDGAPLAAPLANGYAVVEREWKCGDAVTLELPMPIRRVVADERVAADRGAVALQRGPLVYCAEWPDQPEESALFFLLEDGVPLRLEDRPELLGGVRVVTAAAKVLKQTQKGDVAVMESPLTAIPYYAWAHRGPGEMSVWMARDAATARPQPLPTIASTSRIEISRNVRGTVGLVDRLDPANSNDHSMPYVHWWPNYGTREWVEYHFKKPACVSSTRVYWFDDEPWGGCRVPASWALFYRDGAGEWRPVQARGLYTCDKDRYNTLAFEPVTTSALRMEIQMKPEVSGGILEWAVEQDS
jgi:uncharacterized protein